MELSKEALARREAQVGNSLLGGEGEAFAAARRAAKGALGRFAKRTDDVELYRFFTPRAKRWLEATWPAPRVQMQRNDVSRCQAGCEVPYLGGYKVYAYNGACFAEEGVKLAEQPNGVIYGSLAAAAQQHPALVQQCYASLAVAEDDLVRANTLLAEDGVFIYIPAGVRVEQPIQVVLTTDARESQSVELRNLIIVEELGDASIVFCDCTLASSPSVAQHVTECTLGRGADVDFVLLQNRPDEALQLHHVFALQQEDSHFHSSVFTMRGGAVRNNVYVTLAGKGAEASCNGLAFVNGGQYVDMHTLVRHAAEHCTSNQLYKTIVDGDGESNFYGIIDVQRGAQQTEAYQRNANILMSPAAKAHTRPQLIIHADDVKCSHGATVGQFDDEARFYMMQRGLDPDAVNRLLVQGFADDVVAMMPDASLQAYLRDVVEKRLMGGAACGGQDGKCSCEVKR